MKFSYSESKLTRTITISVTSTLHGKPFTTEHCFSLKTFDFHRRSEYFEHSEFSAQGQAIRDHYTAKQQRLAEAFGTTHATFTTSESNSTPERATRDAMGLGDDDTTSQGLVR